MAVEVGADITLPRIQSTKMSFSLDTLTMSVQQTAEDLDRFSKSHDESKKTLEKILETVSPVNFVREQQEDHGDTIKQILTTVLRLEGKDPFSSSESDSGYSSAPSASPLLVPTEAGTDPPAWGTPSVGLSCSQYQRTPCSVACNCSCHRRARIGSPSVAQRVFGLLFVSYSMLPQRVDRCDVPACKNRSPTKTRITYYFPQWMFLKAINISITKSYFFEPSLQLTMKRIISPVSPIFIAVKEGRIDVIKQLFEKRLASPNDIEGLDGDGVLHV